jgi:F-type H+-transporting ATPase subunit delta
LFEAAKENDRLTEVHEHLSDFLAAMNEVPDLRRVLRNPQLDPATKAGIVEDLLGEADPLVQNFLRLTAEKGRIGEIDEIAREFDRLLAAEERRLEVELTTAYELSDDEANGILEQIQQASGRKVDASRKVDPSLIGGFVLQAGSLRVDASIRGRIDGLRHDLIRRS